MKLMISLRSSIAAITVALPSAALAHSGHADHQLTWADGLLHPFTGFDHIALLACGGALLALSQPDLRLTKATMVGLGGVLAGGFAAMMGSIPIALLGLIAAIMGFAVAGPRTTKGQTRLVLVGTVIAISAQAASHLLAWGDASPNLDFAAGFGFSSLGLFALVCLLTRTFVAGNRLPRTKAQ